ncbi:MAG TPA: response regulator [Segetibacter sp.]|jgi:CheY-like chemotaxis protein
MDKFQHILIAEDDFDDFKFIEEAFEKVLPTSKVARANNGLECMNYLKKNNKPDIIFLDLNMPIKNGLDCLKFIKDNVALADIPVVIYSTSHYIKDIDAAFKNEAHYYIVKPVCGKHLADFLRKVLQNLNLSHEKPRKENFVVRLTVETETR